MDEFKFTCCFKSMICLWLACNWSLVLWWFLISVSICPRTSWTCLWKSETKTLAKKTDARVFKTLSTMYILYIFANFRHKDKYIANWNIFYAAITTCNMNNHISGLGGEWMHNFAYFSIEVYIVNSHQLTQVSPKICQGLDWIIAQDKEE